MTGQSFFFLLFFFLHTNAYQPNLANLDTLQLVQIFHRHGDKNPTYAYPTDPYRNESYWPGGWGQLTELGVNQTYELGLFLRKRYGDFISKKYDQHEIYVLSSDTERTIRSAMSTLTGIFDGIDLNDIKIPVRTMTGNCDNVFTTKKPCEILGETFDTFLHTSEFLRPINEENAEFFSYISRNSGLNLTILDKQLGYFHDALLHEDKMHYQLPNWTTPIHNTPQMFKLVALALNLKMYDPRFQRLALGPLFQLIKDNLRANVERINRDDYFGKPPPPSHQMHDFRRRMIIFSGHDTNIANLMYTFGVYETIRPSMASALLLELHKDVSTGNYFLQLWYRNDTTREPYLLSIQDSQNIKISSSSLENFLDFIQTFIPESWEKECEIIQVSKESGHEGNEGTVQFFFGASVGLAIAVLFGLVLKFWPTRVIPKKGDYVSLP